MRAALVRVRGGAAGAASQKARARKPYVKIWLASSVAMRPEMPRFLIDADIFPRLELALHTPDGDPWVLSLAPAMVRFIGHYPRVEGIGSDSPLLEYRIAHAAD